MDRRNRLEQAVLGAMLVSSVAFEAAIGSLDESDFLNFGHRMIFRSMRTMNDSRIALDWVTLTDFLREKRLLRLAGGPKAVTKLLNFANAAAPIDYYARALKGTL